MAEDKRKLAKDLDRARTGRKRGEDLSHMVFGKLPPQNLALEEVVLGSIMLDKEALTNVIDVLQPETFYKDAHQHIYRAMRRLFERSQPIDMITVREELLKAGELEAIGGTTYLVELTNKVASSANIEYHARILSQKWIQRELIRISNDTIRDAYEDTIDVFDLLDNAEQGLFQIAEHNMGRRIDNMGSLSHRLLEELEELKNRKDGLTGIPSGFTDLDRLTSGLQRSDFIIIAGRPAMGKTSFALSLAKNAAIDFEKPIAIFSLEMSSLQLATRIVSMEAEIEGSKMRNGQLEDAEWEALNRAIDKIGDAPIFIDDTPGINIFELRAKCRRLKLQHDIQLVVIDYLQLMTGGKENTKGNREQEVGAISRALKGLAKELDVPVIALAQLSRAVEVRGGNKKPMLSDLRESGSIEQDADIVCFLYRPEYYQIMEDEEGNSNKGVAEVIVAKHRHGATDTIRLRFIDKYARFGNLDDMNFDELPGGTFDTTYNPNITLPSKINDDEDIPF
jgi:replicative DNA helicase